MPHNTLRSCGEWKPVSAIALVCLACTIVLAGKGMATPADRPATQSSGTGVEILTTLGHARGVKGAAFFPGGSKLVTVGGDATLQIWDTETGALVGLYRGHEVEVNTVAVSPSGTRLVSGDVKGNVLLWSYGSNAGPRTLYTHTVPVQDVVFTSDERALSLVHGEQETILVVHNLLQGDSSPSLFSAPIDQHYGASFMGNQYLVVGQEEQPDLYDLTTWELVQMPEQISISERITANVHLLSASEILWSSDNLAGVNTSTGTGFALGHSRDARSKFHSIFPVLLAVDQSSRKIAFFDDSMEEELLSYALDYPGPGSGDGLHLATMLSFGDQFGGFERFFGDGEGSPKLMRYVGRIPELHDGSQFGGDPLLSVRKVRLGSAIADIVGDSFLQDIVIQPDAIGDGAFHLSADAFSVGIYGSGPAAVQLLDEKNELGSCGSGGCTYHFAYSIGMSPDSRLAVVSSDNGIGGIFPDPEEYYRDDVDLGEKKDYGEAALTKVWLYHDAESVEQAQNRLAARGYELGEVDGLWGKQTEAAVVAFQRATHLGQTGVLDRMTRRALGLREEPPRPQQGAGRWFEYHLPEVMDKTFFGHFGFSPNNRFLALVTICAECAERPERLVHLDLHSGALQQLTLNQHPQASGPITAVGLVSDHELLITYSRGAVVVDLQTRRTTYSPLTDLERVADIRSYNQGALVSLDGDNGLGIIAKRAVPGQSYTELARTFHSEEGWLAITPEGFFAGSEALARSLAIRIGTQVLKMDQFYQTFYQPNLVRKKLQWAPMAEP